MTTAGKPYRSILVPLIAQIFFAAPHAFALPRPDVEMNRAFRAFAEASYFNTTSNYDSGGGSFTELGNGRYYRLIQTQLGGEYFFLPQFSVVAQFGFARAESSDGTYTRTRSQPTEVTLGARYGWIFEDYHFVPEFLFTYPLNRVEPGSDNVLTGEGATQVQAGAWGEAEFGVMVPYGYLGYVYLDDGRASQLAYTLGIGYRPPGWNLAIESFGARRMSEDENSQLPALRDAVTTQVDGGSMKFYAVNPNFWAARVIGETDVTENFRLGASFDHTLNGENTARGWTAMVRLELAFGGETRTDHAELLTEEESHIKKSMPRKIEILQQESSEQKEFVPETPKYDSTLFEEPKPKTRSRKMTGHSKKKTPKKVDIDKSLEEVQRALEK